MKHLFLPLIVFCATASCAAETVFVVDAQKGNDANPGTVAAPFATALKARDAVRALKASGRFPADGVAVELNGTFDWPMGAGLSLDEKDSGLSSAAPVTWRAGKNGAVFTGAYRLSARDFAVVTDAATLARLRPEARGKVYACDLAKRGVGELKPLPRQFTQWGEMELFAGGKDMTIARWPNTGWIQIPKVIDRGVKPVDHATGEWEHGYKGGVFTYEGDEPARWNVAKGVYMVRQESLAELVECKESTQQR